MATYSQPTIRPMQRDESAGCVQLLRHNVGLFRFVAPKLLQHSTLALDYPQHRGISSRARRVGRHTYPRIILSLFTSFEVNGIFMNHYI
jgi:hypothetical protein